MTNKKTITIMLSNKNVVAHLRYKGQTKVYTICKIFFLSTAFIKALTLYEKLINEQPKSQYRILKRVSSETQFITQSSILQTNIHELSSPLADYEISILLNFINKTSLYISLLNLGISI